MKNLLFALLLAGPLWSLAQSPRSISVLDFVAIKDNKWAEALYFYEHNWKVYRDIALKRGFIESYQILMTTRDSVDHFDLVLVTQYQDSTQFTASEENFQKIIRETRPNGPRLLNSVRPGDFRTNLFFKKLQVVFADQGKGKNDR